MADTSWKGPVTQADLLALHAMWKRVGTRAMINAIRFIADYEPPPPPPPK